MSRAWQSANQLADLLAKQAAATVRVSSKIRREVADQFSKAKDIAVFVGQLTAAAGSFINPDGTISRDSEEFHGKLVSEKMAEVHQGINTDVMER